MPGNGKSTTTLLLTVGNHDTTTFISPSCVSAIHDSWKAMLSREAPLREPHTLPDGFHLEINPIEMDDGTITAALTIGGSTTMEQYERVAKLLLDALRGALPDYVDTCCPTHPTKQ